MSMTAVAYCSAALAKLGAQPITSFDDDRTEADVAGRLYPLVRDSVLIAHPWSFSMAQAELVRDETAPAGDFAGAFPLPADLLRTISAGSGRSGRGLLYRIFGDRLHADAERVLLTYQRRVPDEALPPFVHPALISRLAAEFCLPITENSARTEVLSRLASAELQLAKLVDSQQATPKRFEDFTLIQARFQ